MAIWKMLLNYKVHLVLKVASVIHLHCGSSDQRLSMPPETSEDKPGSATLVFIIFHLAHLYLKHRKLSNTRSPSIIPFPIFFRLPNSAKPGLQFICFFRGRRCWTLRNPIPGNTLFEYDFEYILKTDPEREKHRRKQWTELIPKEWLLWRATMSALEARHKGKEATRAFWFKDFN